LFKVIIGYNMAVLLSLGSVKIYRMLLKGYRRRYLLEFLSLYF